MFTLLGKRFKFTILFQDSIRQVKEAFIKILFEKEAILFVCGDAKNMSKDVNETIIECTAQVLGKF